MSRPCRYVIDANIVMKLLLDDQGFQVWHGTSSQGKLLYCCDPGIAKP